MSDDRKEQTEWTTDHMGIGRSLTDGDRAVFLRAVEWVIEEGVKRGRDPSTDTHKFEARFSVMLRDRITGALLPFTLRVSVVRHSTEEAEAALSEDST